MDFAEFMAGALYHPELGYYAKEPRQVGRGGDFFTSVSVGPLFGKLLARRFLAEWQSLGSPDLWRILECGAHDGTLARDILEALSQLSADAFRGLEYVIAEPLARLRSAQQATLAGFSNAFRSLADITALADDPLPGIVFGNEVLDALPCHLVEWSKDAWKLCRVGCEESGFVWDTNGDADSPALRQALAKICGPFPDGYRTEIRTCYSDFLTPFTRCLTRGLLLWPDYGFARPEFYHPDRIQGTLRTFSKHRAAADPLLSVGEIDITAHVDYTAVAEAATDLGAVPVDFRNQGAWLTEAGRDWLLGQEGNRDSSLLRQFQTLVHPAHLGSSFHILELAWNRAGVTAPPAVLHRLALVP